MPADGQWKRMMFKGCKVFARVDTKGTLVNEHGRVLLKYRLDQEQSYSAPLAAVKEIDEAAHKSPPPQPSKAQAARKSKKVVASRTAAADGEGIVVYTDGACVGNPGPAGIGVVLRYRTRTKEISRFIGTGTNNIAELTAIKVALQEIKDPWVPVTIHTDSAYCLGVLAGNWKPKLNRTLIEEIKKEMARFARLTFVKVEGHTGIEDNEKANDLAQQAVQRRTS